MKKKIYTQTFHLHKVSSKSINQRDFYSGLKFIKNQIFRFFKPFSLRNLLRKWRKNPKSENLKFSKMYISRSSNAITKVKPTKSRHWIEEKLQKKNFKKFSLEILNFLFENSSFLVFFDIPQNPDLGYVQIAVQH